MNPAHTQGTPEEILSEFRRVRDQIKRVFEAYACTKAAYLHRGDD